MSRPIPEGLRDGVIFDVGRTPGISFRAADAGSEVARLNACPDLNCTDGRTFVTDLEGQPKQIQCGCEEDPRDGAIKIRTDLERDLLGLLFSPRYSDLSLDQIRTLASGYVYPESTKLWADFEIPERDETSDDGR